MAAQKPLQIVNGLPTEVPAVESSAGAGDEGKLVALNAAGQIDATMLPASGALTYPASEAIAAGALINLWNNAGNISMRNADNTSSAKRAHGFAPAAVTSGANGTAIIGEGYITGLSALTIGEYFLGTAGGLSTTAPTATGSIVQRVGFADSNSTLQFNPGEIYVRA